MTDSANGVSGPAAGTQPEGLTRGFLFADLRGYTSFVESHGARAGAKLLDRYRLLVREQVARFDGAEIKTEGDSFYVVFGSVSRAVECALGITARAAEATEQEPNLPIRPGVGVHAGETVETSEGYVGSAVNMAARLCSAAAPGEVLVSDTVRTITANASMFGYEPLGRRRLKGIAEVVTVYRARPVGTPPAPKSADRRRLPMILGAGAGLVLVVLVGVALQAFGGEVGTTPDASPSGATASGSSAAAAPSATTGPSLTLPVGPLAPGEYTSVAIDPHVTFRVGDGWTLVAQQNQILHLTSSEAQGRDLYVTRFQDPIEPDNPSSHVIGIDRSADFVEWLSTHPYVSAESPISVDLPGSRGLSIDFSADIPESEGQPGCPQACVALYWISEGGLIPPDRFGIIDGSRYRLVALDRHGDSPDTALIVVVVEVQRAADFDAFVAEAQPVITSLRFNDD